MSRQQFLKDSMSWCLGEIPRHCLCGNVVVIISSIKNLSVIVKNGIDVQGLLRPLVCSWRASRTKEKDFHATSPHGGCCSHDTVSHGNFPNKKKVWSISWGFMAQKRSHMVWPDSTLHATVQITLDYLHKRLFLILHDLGFTRPVKALSGIPLITLADPLGAGGTMAPGWSWRERLGS